ncbi:MAG: hypothetical protein JWM42_2854 [Burkholderia sp.]|jgi:hypothetical protein|nr:hypothetical protein [Burkholderia sp.]
MTKTRSKSSFHLFACASLFLFSPIDAASACLGEEKLLFSCTTKNNKQINLCDTGKIIRYSYGKTGSTPELSLAVPRKTATTYQWQGTGRWANYIVNVPNRGTVYRIFWGYDRLSDEHEIEAGVNVTVNGNDVSTVHCKNASIEHDLEGVDLRAE